jgi:hypothetical protein
MAPSSPRKRVLPPGLPVEVDERVESVSSFTADRSSLSVTVISWSEAPVFA